MSEILTLVLTTILVCFVQTTFYHVKDKLFNKSKVRKEKDKK